MIRRFPPSLGIEAPDAESACHLDALRGNAPGCLDGSAAARRRHCVDSSVLNATASQSLAASHVHDYGVHSGPVFPAHPTLPAPDSSDELPVVCSNEPIEEWASADSSGLDGIHRPACVMVLDSRNTD